MRIKFSLPSICDFRSRLLHACRRISFWTIAPTLLGLTFAGNTLAQSNPTVRNDRPDVYTVQKGDTLWDISGRFLREPWLWPEIWDANPQIENPHLIYPGDEVSLTYRDGRPILRLSRGGRGSTVKLSPKVRVVQRGSAIPAIPIDAISQFLSHPRVVGEDTLRRAPYIVSVGKEHLIAGAGFKVYARGRGLTDGERRTGRFTVYRQGSEYLDPTSGEVLGYEAIHVGDAVVERDGDPATLRLIASKREVLRGDRLLPVDEDFVDENMWPRAPDAELNGSIIEVVEGVTQIGQYQVVVLNLGAQQGVQPGHVMGVFRKGDVIVDEFAKDARGEVPKPSAVIELDPEKQGGADGLSIAADQTLRSIQRLFETEPQEVITLPEERAGTVMVFRAYDRISYALVMDAVRPMHVRDTVRNP
jgi:hypothetical protein